ncbi:MAG: glycosyl hydrolase [Candidatus Omnitrophota bacterium]|nr:glycoside hydrolase family 26 protein [Candidatus Omnitrophota bacterium]
MKKLFAKIIVVVIVLTIVIFIVKKIAPGNYCLTGAFMADEPTKKNILDFEKDYGKKPFIVLVFVDWGKFVPREVISAVYKEECVLMVTWEPWKAWEKEGINYKELLAGKYDAYIDDFAVKLKNIEKPVFLRFAHEMNGNWYPWSGNKIGRDMYIKMYRYVYKRMKKVGANNVRWVFSINAEDVPKEKNNHSLNYYPGNRYVDYVGIDGYNWGDTHSWSKWVSFKGIFEKPYKEITAKIPKPIIITEFSSADTGGDKAVWIKEAMEEIKRLKRVKAFALFNVDKEAKWQFAPAGASGEALKKQLTGSYFKDKK